ncbi:hypothetical protein Leryth_004888 [Lithospermum erythrorhizon]|uniref:Transmembrane protein n=1 Tax=Lithospermum erythrorhizon TaxID=34254 RepID=A0AAV3PS80_LITER|nr:hypothetical protein Leryth_004888 [Lithospermum erythrorhizon]
MSTTHKITSIAFSFFLILLSTTLQIILTIKTPTAYQVLQSYNFPIGLLPQGTTGYDLDQETGNFNAYFKGPCSFSLEDSYELKYSSKISGTIQKDKLMNLSGISVKVVLVWLNIVEVKRDGDNLQFSVGITSADFPIDNFYECPHCGCGLDCNEFENRDKNRGDSLVSSS